MRSRRGTPALFTQPSLTLISGNLACYSEVNFRQKLFPETRFLATAILGNPVSGILGFSETPGGEGKRKLRVSYKGVPAL
jgi:hypothetical protein